MSKAHRGRPLRTEVPNARACCPVCKRTGIKTIYEYTAEDKTIKTCKACKAGLARGTKKIAL